MKRKLLIIIFAVIGLGVLAQKMSFGVKGGINYLSLDNYGGGTYTLCEYRSCLSAGITAQYKWGDFLNFAIQPELVYSQSQTYIHPVVGLPLGDIRLIDIELPINFQMGLQLSPIFRPFVSAGLGFCYLIDTKVNDNLYSDGSLGFGSFNKFNVSFSGGAGFDLWNFQMQGRYRANVTRLNNTKQIFDKLLLSGFELSLTYFFLRR
ncbi:hypothetical protein BN938_0820 [Mucinivorans hirudinis]|uniref:Outer membrane protein beta-barrel domain-containing protein n=1 Tax=Mucinivorans hirudinis TaxID=1433126 RepID=A0A060R6X8_9BACT|nr:hypothetical protein BN938_0820 [Mucinivorans hirudinis]